MTEQANPTTFAVPTPQPAEEAHLSPKRGSNAHDLLASKDDRVAIEFPEFSREQALKGRLVQRRLSDASTEIDQEVRRRPIRFNSYRLVRQEPKWYDGLVNFWHREISIKLDAQSRRDHLALERTYMGYMRTSVALSTTGIVVAQLFRLQHSYNPNLEFGFFVTGIPLAACFIFLAIIVQVIGFIRFWRQQKAMIRGKVLAGGWEINVVMGGSMLLCIALFAIVIGVTIQKAT